MQVENRNSGHGSRCGVPRPWPGWVVLIAAMLLAGCSNMPWLSAAGPSAKQIDPSRKETLEVVRMEGIQIVEVNDAIARRLLASRKQGQFSDTFAAVMPKAYVVGAGDIVEVSVWEAPPAMLFGGGTTPESARSGPSTTRVTSFPEQMVDDRLALRSAEEIERRHHAFAGLQQGQHVGLL